MRALGPPLLFDNAKTAPEGLSRSSLRSYLNELRVSLLQRMDRGAPTKHGIRYNDLSGQFSTLRPSRASIGIGGTRPIDPATRQPGTGQRRRGPTSPHPRETWLDASSTKGDTWDRGKQIPSCILTTGDEREHRIACRHQRRDEV